MKTLILFAGLLLCCGAARADGAADLKAALRRATALAPVRASIDVNVFRRLGEVKESDVEQGQATALVEDGPRGLSIAYGRDIVVRLEAEQRAKGADSNKKLPTAAALRELEADDVLPMVSAAPRLLRQLEKATLRGERAESYAGKDARLLTFDIPIDTLSSRERKYAKRFESTLDVWTALDGTPLASRLRQLIAGSVFVVVRFEYTLEEDCVYSLVGDRLLTLRRETRNRASGAGEKDEGKVTRNLQISATAPQ